MQKILHTEVVLAISRVKTARFDLILGFSDVRKRPIDRPFARWNADVSFSQCKVTPNGATVQNKKHGVRSSGC